MSILIRFSIICLAYAVLQGHANASHSCNTKSLNMARNLYHKYKLRSRVIESHSISDPIDCFLRCMKNCRCASYNVCNGGKVCELNSETKKESIFLYGPSHDCDYNEFIFNNKQTRGCKDTCCVTSKPCLNGGRCQATCMEKGKRFHCHCSEGHYGDHCEHAGSLPRSCAFYAKSSNNESGLRLIYAPDNTPYHVFCYYDPWSVQTLAMSYSRDNIDYFKTMPMDKDFPVSENSHNWAKYRLSLARMATLRDESYQWKITCSYQLQGMRDDDYLKVNMENVDPLIASGGYCIKVPKIRIKGQGCDHCVVQTTHGNNAWHMKYMHQSSCSKRNGFVNVVPSIKCGKYEPSYFGNYKAECFDEKFSCTSSGDSTTQLWFIHKLHD